MYVVNAYGTTRTGCRWEDQAKEIYRPQVAEIIILWCKKGGLTPPFFTFCRRKSQKKRRLNKKPLLINKTISSTSAQTERLGMAMASVLTTTGAAAAIALG